MRPFGHGCRRDCGDLTVVVLLLFVGCIPLLCARPSPGLGSWRGDVLIPTWIQIQIARIK